MQKTAKAVINGLAIVGFVILVGAGIWLAVYSTRYVPTVVNRVGAAAVYFGSLFTSADGPTLSVVPNASTTIPFGEASSTPANSTISKPVTSTPVKPVSTTAGEKTNTTQQISDAPTNILSVFPISSRPSMPLVISQPLLRIHSSQARQSRPAAAQRSVSA